MVIDEIFGRDRQAFDVVVDVLRSPAMPPPWFASTNYHHDDRYDSDDNCRCLHRDGDVEDVGATGIDSIGSYEGF